MHWALGLGNPGVSEQEARTDQDPKTPPGSDRPQVSGLACPGFTGQVRPLFQGLEVGGMP